MVKNPPVRWRHGFNPWAGKIPWRRKWQPTSVFLPGKSHGQRSLVGYSPWSCKGVRYDWMTKQQTKKWVLTLNTFQRKFILLLDFFFFLLEKCWKYFFLFSDIYCLVAELYPFSTIRLLCLWDSPGKNTRMGCHFLLWGTFPTQGLNLCLLLGRQILYLWTLGKSLVWC